MVEFDEIVNNRDCVLHTPQRRKQVPVPTQSGSDEPMKRFLFPRLLAAALVLASMAAAQAQDRRFDPKALARYDASYVRCEASFPEMKGRRDDAYLNLWRVKPGPKATARLAAARSSAPYQAEHRLATARRPSPAAQPDAVKALERQCRGLYGELERTKAGR